MSTGADLVKSTLRLIGVIASGETPTAADQADGIAALNELKDLWSTEGLTVPKVVREEFPLLSSQQTYTMGDDVLADFNSPRPATIVAAGILDNGTEMPMEILTPEQWQEVSQKSLTSSIPSHLYQENNSPLENVIVWPIPDQVKTLVLYSLKPIGDFVAADDIELPPGYLMALRFNLAVVLAPEYGKVLSPEIAALAKSSKAQIMRKNTKPSYMVSDAYGLVNRKTFNIYTGR